MSVAYDYRPPSGWTPEILNDLHTHLKAGVSRELIAQRIYRDHGIKFTKNAVCGQTDRMGWSVPRSEARQPRGDNRIRRRDRGVARLRVVEAPEPWGGSLDIPLLKIGANQCREITGHDGRFALFCGNPTTGSSWCPHHRAINIQPPRVRQ